MTGERGSETAGGRRGRRPRRRALSAARASAALAVLAIVASAAPASADTTTTPCFSPQVISVPRDETVTAGQSATFSALYPVTCFNPPAVIGTTYWEVSTDGGGTFEPIAGSSSVILSTGSASTSLTVPDTTVSMSGDEYVAVFQYDSGVETTTPPATLTVQPAATSTSTSTSSSIPPTTTSSTSTAVPATTTTTTNAPGAALPVVSGVDPSSGDSNSPVLIHVTGSRARVRVVDFGGAPARYFIDLNSAYVIALAPAQAKGRVDVTVGTLAGTSAVSATDGFTYLN